MARRAGRHLPPDLRRGRRRRGRHRGDRSAGGERGDRQGGRGRRAARAPPLVSRVSITCVDRGRHRHRRWSATSWSPGPSAPSATRSTPPRGESLAESGDFKAQLDQAPDDRVGFAYADPRAIVDALEKAGRATADRSVGGPQLEPLLVAAGRRVGLGDRRPARAPGIGGGRQPPRLRRSRRCCGTSRRTRGSPSRLGDAGQAYGRLLGQAGRPGGPRSSSTAGSASTSATSSAAGPETSAGSSAGTSLFGLGGALVLETSDEQASAQTLDELQRALGSDPRLSVEPLTDARRAGILPQPRRRPDLSSRSCSTTARWSPASPTRSTTSSRRAPRSSDSDAFNAATDALGEDFSPAAFIDFVPLFQLVDGFPQAQRRPDYRSAKPLPRPSRLLRPRRAAEDDRAELRMVLGLRDDAGARPRGVRNDRRGGGQMSCRSRACRAGHRRRRDRPDRDRAARAGAGAPAAARASGCSPTASLPTRALAASAGTRTSRPGSPPRRRRSRRSAARPCRCGRSRSRAAGARRRGCGCTAAPRRSPRSEASSSRSRSRTRSELRRRRSWLAEPPGVRGRPAARATSRITLRAGWRPGSSPSTTPPACARRTPGRSRSRGFPRWS